MNTRHTIHFLAIALSITLFLPPRSSIAADEPGNLSFLKVGSTYHVNYPGAPMGATVKILEPAGGHWFRVEFYTVRVSPDGKPFTSVSKPHETWINFANVVSVTESKEPDKREPDKK